MAGKKCTPKKTISIKNANGSKSRFSLKNRSTSKTAADKKAAAIRKKGKRATVRKNCGGYSVYEGPKRKAFTIKATGQRVAGRRKRKAS